MFTKVFVIHRRNTMGIPALIAVMMLAAAALFSAGIEEYDAGTLSPGGDPSLLDVQEKFDYMGPAVRKLELSSGKTVAYVDEGEEDWIPVLYAGGAGTAARAMSLTDFLRTFRGQLGLRLITVGRNGFGETEYLPDWEYEDYAAEVAEVLDHLGVDSFVGMAISGGGPYLAAVASAVPDRLISIHMAAALSQSAPDSWNAVNDIESIMKMLRGYPANPLQWWYLGDTSPMAVVPGFQDTANEDGTRSFFMGGQRRNERRAGCCRGV
jgi:non-heme chloroperoxidase